MKKTIKLSSRLEDLNKETQEKLLKLHKEKYVTMAKLCLIDFDIIITSVKDNEIKNKVKENKEILKNIIKRIETIENVETLAMFDLQFKKEHMKMQEVLQHLCCLLYDGALEIDKEYTHLKMKEEWSKL